MNNIKIKLCEEKFDLRKDREEEGCDRGLQNNFTKTDIEQRIMICFIDWEKSLDVDTVEWNKLMKILK